MADSLEHRDRRVTGALAVLRLVHEHPGVTRSDVGRSLGLSTSSTTEITARLRTARLISEETSELARQRGRPSARLVANEDGPVVLAVEIAYGRCRVAAVELGGRIATERSGGLARTADVAMDEIRRRSVDLHNELGARVRAVGVSITGTVSGSRLLQAATLRWRSVELRSVLPRALDGVPFVAGNDATVAGLAEARRGAATGASVVLYLAVDVGVGGILVVDGQPITGALGEGGEFGHMPLGTLGLPCPCGATGCWDLEVDGRALARALGRRAPTDPRGYAERVLAAARTGASHEAAAVNEIARALGRGTGALVNALDPDLVVYGGLAPAIHEASRGGLDGAYRSALMRHRRQAPPAVVASVIGADGALLGAAEQAFDLVLTPRLLDGPG